MKYYPQTFTRDDAERWVTRSLERYRRDGYGLFAVVLKSDGEVIGNCGPVRQDVEGESLLEVGYHFRRDHWGHGYATEAARGLHGICLWPVGRGESGFAHSARRTCLRGAWPREME